MPGVVSITTTKRRRYLWCAWWTGEPTRAPFRKPDASSGGAKTLEEARKQAERAAGQPLREIEAIWARAWIRVQAGQPPWVESKTRTHHEEPPPQDSRQKRRRSTPTIADPTLCPFEVLGLPKTASPDDIRRAFRRRALETHPDRGGNAAAFIRVTWARDEATFRAAKRV
ncbi:J domain-containing protein [Polyangium fumosum]|uniref:J domain-containing protein n=1 Tax=Polyangium fumosum TaxID=889272 RepID=A0A4U1JDG1_9BACT|nr:J domain-containing protein [Polyangium fumosum]TKD08538.1 J domain-containing protein [Polyangium fumosum]